MSIDRFQAALETCAFCPKLCRFACPVAESEGNEAVTPWGLLTRADNIRRGLTELDGTAATLWTHCTGCGACTAQCKHENPVAETIYGLRALLVASGLADERLGQWAGTAPAYKGVFGLPDTGRILVIPGLLPEAQVRDWLEVLERAGLKDMYGVDGFHNAGGRLLQSGQEEAFEAHVETWCALANEAEVILCLNPDDYQTLGQSWGPRLNEGIRIEHVLHRLDPIMNRLSPIHEGDLLLLDNCRLSRDPALASTARRVLDRLITGRIVESLMHGIESGCCGAGAGYAAVHMVHGQAVAREAVADTGMVDMVAFGECLGHLQSAISARRVYGFGALVLRGLKGGGDS